MKWAVYYQKDDISCEFYTTRPEALDRINELIAECDQKSADAEKNLHWDITLLESKGEVEQTPDGLCLVTK